MTSAEIRLACFGRSGGLCECGCGSTLSWESGELDHQRGRVRESQSVENCWFLSHECHQARTENRPSGRHWWWRVAVHALHHGYGLEANHAQVMLDKLKLKGF